MRMCPQHWQSIIDELGTAGLAALIPGTVEERHTRLLGRMTEGITVDTFDPLMGAHEQLVRHMLSIYGQTILHAAGAGCPLCLLHAEHVLACSDPTCTWAPVDWIGWAAGTQVQVWESLRA